MMLFVTFFVVVVAAVGRGLLISYCYSCWLAAVVGHGCSLRRDNFKNREQVAASNDNDDVA